MLFRPGRGIRRYAQDELAFRDPHAVYAGIDLKLHQVVYLRQSFGAKVDLFPRPDGTKEFHAPDRGKKKERLWNFGVTRGRRDAGRLRERLGQDDAGDKGITRKMTDEDRIIRGKRRRGFRENARVALDQFAHEDKRRSMWQTEERLIKGNTVSHIFFPQSGLQPAMVGFRNPVFFSAVDEIDELPASVDAADAHPVSGIVK